MAKATITLYDQPSGQLGVELEITSAISESDSAAQRIALACLDFVRGQKKEAEGP